MPSAPPDAAAAVFGAALPAVEQFGRLLAEDGVRRGLLGPREAERIWERHLLNCGVLAEVVPDGATVADLGSGAGLPGIVLALARPDLRVTLIEPLLRRTRFLTEALEALGRLDVTVCRDRAETLTGRLAVDVVVARAVAPLPKLAALGLPLLRRGGVLAAVKGERAADELADWRRAGLPSGTDVTLVTCGAGLLDPATRVALVRRTAPARPHGRGG